MQIWSLGSNDPIHVLVVDSNCDCLVWSSNGNRNGTKEERTKTTSIAWSDVLTYYDNTLFFFLSFYHQYY
jgi:hypothetical protein